jgi:dihydropteroate synthase
MVIPFFLPIFWFLELQMINKLNCGGRVLNLNTPQVMGILNVTPDSFSDGGSFNTLEKAFSQAKLMQDQGASILDIGGESTRPGSKGVSVQEELDRVIPVIERINQQLDIIVSIDTSKAEVMREAKLAGAGLINDVMALQGEGALHMASTLDIPICLMHMQGAPRTMQSSPQYSNVIIDLLQFFEKRVKLCLHAGISKDHLVIDPGFGFGKTLEHNLQLLNSLAKFLSLDLPLLVGLSRKSLLKQLTDRDVNERTAGSLSLAVIAAINGAKIFRVHDVKETIDALKVVDAIDQLKG